MELDIRRFDEPDEVRTFDKGVFEVITVEGLTIGRARYEPGWVWSEHVGPTVGAATCPVNIGLVVSGRAGVRMNDGRDLVMNPGDLFAIPPGHDSWVVGDEPYVSLHFLGAANYAAAHD